MGEGEALLRNCFPCDGSGKVLLSCPRENHALHWLQLVTACWALAAATSQVTNVHVSA